MRASQFIPEGRVKELAQDLKDKSMSDADFEKKYSKTRADARAAMRKPASESVAGPKNCWPGYRKTGTQPGTGKNAGKRVNDCEKIKEQGVAEGNYDRDDYYNARRGSEYGRGLAATGYGGDGSATRRDDIFKGQSKRLPADPFARTTGAVPTAGTGRIHSTAYPDEMDEGEKIGNMDADDFDAAMSRLKKLAGAGPMKTVYDPQKRVYKNMPTAQQPPKQPKNEKLDQPN